MVRVAVPLLAGRALSPFIARFASLPRALAHAQTTDEADAVDVDVAAEVVKGIEGMLRVFPRGGGTCLTRTLARTLALRHAGLPVRFVLGVRAENGAPSGHSWLELDGRPFLEPRTENLAAFNVIYADDAR
ncbi:MAG: lasso peptide biosynthesis B2 protein [Deltaproteobacteria bacterium]|nr:lasso peptide biosynthesis B2 protein [Deltaproteobacteria bacterium]